MRDVRVTCPSNTLLLEGNCHISLLTSMQQNQTVRGGKSYKCIADLDG